MSTKIVRIEGPLQLEAAKETNRLIHQMKVDMPAMLERHQREIKEMMDDYSRKFRDQYVVMGQGVLEDPLGAFMSRSHVIETRYADFGFVFIYPVGQDGEPVDDGSAPAPLTPFTGTLN